MNILIDIRSLLEKTHSGVSQYTLNYLHNLFERDKENNYFLFYNSAKRQNKDLPQFNYPYVKIIDFHWPNKLFNFCLWIFKWPKIDKLVEKNIGKKINEIFLPNFNFIAFSKNLKKILVVHDLSFEFFPYFFTFKQRLWHKLIWPHKICQQADKIIVHSENTKDDLINFYKIDPKKIEIQKPQIDNRIKKLESNDLILEQVRIKYNLPEKFILYLGNLEPRKNLDTLIRAFSYCLIDQLFNYSLVIAGNGRELKKLKKLSQNLGVGEQIKFLGYISEEDKNVLYNLCDFFVFPSFYEGFGYPVYEALACGKKVITSHVSSLIEIDNPNVIFINPYDLNDLTEAIKETISFF